jgi:hypothetical protein
MEQSHDTGDRDSLTPASGRLMRVSCVTLPALGKLSDLIHVHVANSRILRIISDYSRRIILLEVEVSSKPYCQGFP